MKIVADESVDFAIVDTLRKSDIEILFVGHVYSGANDEDVLELSNKENALLITEDKDFGELVFRLKKANLGIILVRLSGLSSELKAKIVLRSLKESFEKMKNSFTVISANQTRIKKLK